MIVNDAETNYSTGFIALYRSIRNNWIWDDPVKFKWWVDILLEVNHTDKVISIGYETFNCNRGQSLNSLSTWANRWRVDKSTVIRFFKMLEKDGMIKTENIKKTTQITVCNYDSYNKSSYATHTRDKRDAYARQTRRNSNNNENNVNNENNDNKYIERFDLFWDLYGKKKDKHNCEKKFAKLKKDDIDKIFETLPAYINSTPDVQFRKNPLTYLNGRCWEDEIKSNVDPNGKAIDRLKHPLFPSEYPYNERNIYHFEKGTYAQMTK